jgi:molybdopterin-guanine dinucleotide biosynthesis protein A
MISPGPDKPLKGLVLAGGKSSRMGVDKSMLEYHGEPQVVHLFRLLEKEVGETYVSCRQSQREQFETLGLRVITDKVDNHGPLAAIYSALTEFPGSCWLVLACDLPLIDETVLTELLSNRDTTRIATSFRSAFDQKPEPLIAIWESHALDAVTEAINNGASCPRKVMMNQSICLIEASEPEKLVNVNAPGDLPGLIPGILDINPTIRE